MAQTPLKLRASQLLCLEAPLGIAPLAIPFTRTIAAIGATRIPTHIPIATATANLPGPLLLFIIVAVLRLSLCIRAASLRRRRVVSQDILVVRMQL